MRVLILGGDGMLGHQLLETLATDHEARVTLRQPEKAYRSLGLFSEKNAIFGLDCRNTEQLEAILAEYAPQAVVNAVGVVKQRTDAQDPILAIEINALFPHRLSRLCKAVGARVVHLSTDCVFSGRKGGYRETDPPDADDLYGRSKLLGELVESHCVTLRTSMIGLEISRKQGLVEWFLASRGPIKGFRRAIFSGLTTQELSRLIGRILSRHRELSGLWHVAAQPIDKYSLLLGLAKRLGRDAVQIQADDTYICDRSLSSEAFANATGYGPPAWDTMLGELAQAVSHRGK